MGAHPAANRSAPCGLKVLYVLDSTVLIDYLRGRPAVSRVTKIWDRGDDLATTAVNVEEVVRGLRLGERQTAETLFSALDVLPVDAAAGWRAGRWRRDFAARGVTLGQADCLIAATALNANAVLATGNPKDFPLEALHIEHWPVGG